MRIRAHYLRRVWTARLSLGKIIAMEVPTELIGLVQRFEQQHEAFRSGRYNETQVRREFIDPLFELLGWDIDNHQGSPEAYKDVVHEDAIKVGGKHKAPDYSFRVGGDRKFFVEAKRPSVNLKEDPLPAFQLRRYAWTAQLPLSILTDFEELAVYNCSIPPSQGDDASVGRIRFYKYANYVEKWSELSSLFSKEAVLGGSFDRFASDTSTKRGTATVDSVFLKEIERWREKLARNLVLLNPGLSQWQLNFAVQMTIDRIIFLRMTEDRGIEEYGRLEQLLSGGHIYDRLRQLYMLADDRYNSGLFHFRKERDRPEHFDELTPTLKIDDEPLRDIIKSLYFPNPYEFSVLPVEVLGQVYEQFLGKVIRLSGSNDVVIEEKPEVRKSGGVYYTPKYIVDYIVDRTLGPLLEGKKPSSKVVRRIKVVDPACGSGSFLIGAYQYLLNWYRDRYVEAGPQNHRKELYLGPGNQWLLTTQEKKRILLAHVYGVDIDPQAVEVTKLSLLLKVLEGETGQSLWTQLSMFRERALPDLDENIKCGNSLIGPEFYAYHQSAFLDVEEQQRVNVFDWRHAFPNVFLVDSPGFDAVIGNPPYDVMEKERGASSWPHIALTEYVRARPEYQDALGGKLNLFRFFIVQSLSLLREDGHFGMIVPLALLADISCARTRHHLMVTGKNLQADCFPQKDNPKRRIFLGAKLSTVIITCEKAKSTAATNAAEVHVRVFPGNSFDERFKSSTILLSDTMLLDPTNMPIPLVDAPDWSLCRQIHSSPLVKRLGEIADFEITRGEINQTIYRRFITDDPTKARLLKGVEVGRYHLREDLSQGHREWFDEEAFLAENSSRPAVHRQRITTQRITGVDERLRVVAALIDPPTYFADSTNSICLRKDSRYRLEYLLALLNSTLFQWRFKLTSTNNNVGTNELSSLPFREIDFKNKEDVASYDQLVMIAERMPKLYEQLNSAKTAHDAVIIKRQISATYNQVDDIVCNLYSLSVQDALLINAHFKPKQTMSHESSEASFAVSGNSQ